MAHWSAHSLTPFYSLNSILFSEIHFKYTRSLFVDIQTEEAQSNDNRPVSCVNTYFVISEQGSGLKKDNAMYRKVTLTGSVDNTWIVFQFVGLLVIVRPVIALHVILQVTWSPLTNIMYLAKFQICTHNGSLEDSR